MKIAVVGTGYVGLSNAILLSQHHDVVALDNDPAVISKLTNIYDVMGVCGNAADCETLEDAGISTAELFIAVTPSDEVNMLSCCLLRTLCDFQMSGLSA